MQYSLTTRICLLLLALAVPASAQDGSSDPPPLGLAQQAVIKAKTAAGASSEQTTREKSLADIARDAQGRRLNRVQVSPEEARKILSMVQPTLRFASADSGLAIHSVVKPRMIGRDDLVSAMQTKKVDDRAAKRLQAEELTLKKFGFVPRVFSTGKFVEGMYAEETAGFYDPRTKTISLLNWVSPDTQLDVLAHELTHALQDQNFNLLQWEHESGQETAAERFQVDDHDALPESVGRRAVVEGQAMVVLIDHQLKDRGVPVSLELIPGAGGAMSEYLAMAPVPDTPVIHAAPIFLRDALAFPYQEGLVFELELLGKGGKDLAFRRVFTRPPLNSHEILHPQAYLKNEIIHAPRIPDLSAMLADKYDVLDAGGLGELDVRSLMKQFDSSRLAESVSRGWRGSSYLLVKRKDVKIENATTADVALIYVSAWDSRETARQFARFYAEAVPRRYSQPTAYLPSTCQAQNCPLERFQFTTEEGLISVQHWPDNLVLVTEGFDPAITDALNEAVLRAGRNRMNAAEAAPDLSLRYAGSPAFADMRNAWERWTVLRAAAFAKN
jgi:hypothetical protein